MKKSITTLTLAAVAFGGAAAAHFARAHRAETQPPAGHFEMAVRAGESVPVTLSAGGDLFEIAAQAPQTLVAKRDLWLRIEGDKFELSLDGTTYRPLTIRRVLTEGRYRSRA